jgi:hypothetical protein
LDLRVGTSTAARPVKALMVLTPAGPTARQVQVRMPGVLTVIRLVAAIRVPSILVAAEAAVLGSTTALPEVGVVAASDP